MNDIIFRVIVPDNKILFKTLMIKGERGLQGTSIVSIEKTQTIGLTDYYTITLNDGTTYEFTVQNGTNSYYDDELSLASENAVQNKIITAAINSINAALASIQQYDNALSSSSENAVQNKVVKSAIDSINSAIALLAQYDSALSDSSENAVQNKVVKAALDLKANLTALNNYYNKTEIDAAFNNLGASGVSYNNASSGLSATDAQAAIDEIKSGLDNKANSSDVYNKSQVDTALSGKADTSTTYTKTESFYCPPPREFASGTTSSDAILWYLNTYGKKSMAFGIIIQGLGWFEVFLTFFSDTQGGGIMILNGSSRLWVVTYINGVITLTEK